MCPSPAKGPPLGTRGQSLRITTVFGRKGHSGWHGFWIGDAEPPHQTQVRERERLRFTVPQEGRRETLEFLRFPPLPLTLPPDFNCPGCSGYLRPSENVGRAGLHLLSLNAPCSSSPDSCVRVCEYTHTHTHRHIPRSPVLCPPWTDKPSCVYIASSGASPQPRAVSPHWL